MLSSENRELLKTVPLYHKIGFEFNDGWTDLIYTLGKNISMYCELHNIPLPEMRQIKEKMGTLRFYYSDESRDTYIRNLVREAEDASDFVCETCGSVGQLMCDGGHWKVVCPEHTPEGSMTADEFKVIQEARSKAMRKCDVCSTKGSEGYYDPSTTIHTNRCPNHVEDYFITDKEYWKQKEKEFDAAKNK